MKDKTMRLLCIVGSMNAGGAETFLMKVYRAIDKTKFQMDFYVNTQEEGFYDKEILEMGGKIFHAKPKSKGPIKSFIDLKNTVTKQKYKSVMRISQHSLSSLDLLAAKIGGARILIYRSSNSRTGGSKLNRILHKIFKFLAITIPNIKIAPSTEAAEFMFGKGCVRNGKAKIIKNAIPLENFIYNQENRDKIRKEFNIENKFVIGHIGRFNKQKNHEFLIDIFNDIIKFKNDSVLLLVGKGELEKDIKNKIEELGLKDKVIFTGVRSDVPELMMAMDVFVFPSFFEGMPNTVIEAQATGLPCIVSDLITKEAKLSPKVQYMSLQEESIEWAKKALEEYRSNYTRKSTKEIFEKEGYDIYSVSKEIFDLICKRIGIEKRGIE